MNTQILSMPTFREIIKEQVNYDITKMREIIVSITSDIKESFIKSYSPSCMPSWWSRRSVQIEKQPEVDPEMEEDKQIKKLEDEIQNIKRKKEAKKKLEKLKSELSELRLSIKQKEEELEIIQSQLQEFDSL